MELETIHDRGFYEAKAKEHKLLEQVIAGETTLKERLDDILTGLEDPVINQRRQSWMGFKDYLSLFLDMGAPIENREELERRTRALGNRVTNKIFYCFFLAGLGFGVFATLLGPLFLTEPIITALAGAGLRNTARDYKLGGETKNLKDEIFESLYNAADYFDMQINREFIIEHFRNARPRFGQTYSALGQKEREQVDERLYALLGVGGMPGMDELQLKDYLTGLMVPQMEGDA